MTPQEKARELVYKYSKFQSGYGYEYKAKQCALIAVDEVLKSQKNIYGVNNKATTFYLEVKQEIENI